MNTPKWKVDVKGSHKGGEICIILENNHHGFKSYGWYGKDKIAIMTVETLYVKSLDKEVWDFAKKVAAKRCKELNRG